MGTFIYDSVVRVELNDQLLAHLQLVITAKLRRNESFAFSWDKQDPEVGRLTVWLHSQIPMVFDFSIEQMPAISREWLNQLTRSANSSTGLHLTKTMLSAIEAAPNAAEPEPAPAMAHRN